MQLVEKLGRDMSGFNHTLMGSQRDMLLLLGEMIQKEVIAAVTGPFGIMVDDMTDIANLEQMLGFIQYYSKSSEKVEVKFLCLENVLANSDKADSETITGVLLKVIEKHGLNFTWFKSFVSDGASVMVGERSGVATRLKADERIQSLISVHCVCHKLALACTDTLNDLSTIKQVQNTLNTLWRLLDNSNKKASIFLKVQLHMNDITLTNKNSKRKVLSSAFNLVATPDLSPTITLAPSDTKLLNHVKMRPCFSMTLRRTPVMVSESALSELARTFSRHRNFTSTFSLLLL